MCFLSTEHLLRHVVRHTPGAHLWLVPVAASATVARGGTRWPRVGRKSQGQEEGHPHGRRRGRHFCRLLVPDTGATLESKYSAERVESGYLIEGEGQQ